MNKLKKNKTKMLVYIVIVGVLVFGGMWLYKNRRVHFEDDKMRQVICLELGKNKDSKDVTYRDLETIEELEIGPVGTFETVEDVAKCRNLKKLWVNVEITNRDASYEVFEKKETGEVYYPPISEERIKRTQKDLKKIFMKVKSIEDFAFTNVNESCNITDVNFLEHAKKLTEVAVCFVNVKDYSVLENCSKLEKVDLSKSDIESADVLLKLKNVKKIWLTDTPLAQNEEEIAKLKKAFPEAKIVVD